MGCDYALIGFVFTSEAHKLRIVRGAAGDDETEGPQIASRQARSDKKMLAAQEAFCEDMPYRVILQIRGVVLTCDSIG